MISKKALTAFRKHMIAAAKEAGVDLEMGTITYNDNYFSFSSKAYVVNSEGKAEEFKKYAAKKGVPADWYGKEFIGNDGERYKIVGIKPRGRKNVLAIEDMTGKGFVCNKGFVTRILNFKEYRSKPVERETLTIAKCETFDPYLEQLSKDLT